MVRHAFATTLALSLGAVLIGHGAGRPVAQGPGSGSTTLDDQVDLGVTVYNSDIALVRDVRDIQLPQEFRSAFRRHRGDGQSGDGAFPFAHRSGEGSRARAELRIRSA